MMEQNVDKFADAWAGYCMAPHDSPTREELWWAMEQSLTLAYHNPELLWKFILAVHRKHRSIAIQQVLSAGPLEQLLDVSGESFIERVEQEARADAAFARLLGGVWTETMNETVSKRVQEVWERRGWDGIQD